MKIVVLLIIFLSLSFGQVNWNREVIDSATVAYFGKFNSLACDTNDMLGVVYWDGGNTVFYAYRLNGMWHKEVVESGFSLVHGLSLAYDNHNTPHISYYRRNFQTPDITYLCYVKRDSLAWQISVIETIPYRFPNWTEIKTSIAIDTIGLPAIAYVSYDTVTGQYVKYAKNNGIFWELSDVECNNMVDYSPSLKFSKCNYPYIAYLQSFNFNDSIKIYTYNSNWVLRWVIIPVGGSAVSLDLEIDIDCNPHIAYCEGAALAYSWWDSYSWHTDYIAGIGWVGVRIRLALDSYGNPHIVYLPDMDVAVHYCYKENGIWHNSGIEPDTAITTPGHPDIEIKISKNNRVDVLYPAERYGCNFIFLKHAWRDLTGIEEDDSKYRVHNPKLEMGIYPSVAEDVLNLGYTIPVSGDVEIVIYDVCGRIVKAIKDRPILPGVYQKTMEIHNLISGVYFLVLKQNNEKVTKKFLKIK